MRICFRRCLSVSNFAKNLPNGFARDFQGRLAATASEQIIQFWWRSGSRIRIRIPDPHRDTSKMCLGGGVHCPSASSFSILLLSLLSINRPMQCIALMRSSTLTSCRVFSLDTHRPTLDHAAVAAASLPPTATNHVIVQINRETSPPS